MADLELSTTDALVQTSFLIQGTLERRATERGFSLIQTRLLAILRDREPTINELASLLGLDKSSVSGLVDRAQRRGLVARRRSSRDGRSVLVVLTEEGRRQVEAVADRFEADLVGLLGVLEAGDRTTLTRLLTRVLINDASRRGVELSPAVSQT
jgi:DNA-binding MarR family transcriptional regulator